MKIKMLLIEASLWIIANVLALDLTVWKAVERVAHRVQRLIGVVSYRLAQQCFVLQVMSGAWRILDYFWPNLLSSDIGIGRVILCFFIVAAYGQAAHLAGRAADKWHSSPTALPAEVLVLFWIELPGILMRAWLCWISLLLIPALIFSSKTWFDGVDTLAAISLPLGFYLMGVRPLPPGERQRLKQLIPLKIGAR